MPVACDVDRLKDLETFNPFSFPGPDQDVLATFETLEEDQFLKDGAWPFRRRGFVRGHLHEGVIEWKEDYTFLQSRAVNGYMGDVVRQFAPACPEIREYIGGLLTNNPFHRDFLADASWSFGLHQIRILADGKHAGFPAPEGVHQDGFDFIGVHCIRRQNIRGAVSHMREGAADGPMLLEGVLEPGQGVFFNDRTLFHHATPIEAISDEGGHRDVVVVTFDRIEE
jgi:hypothetical protein